MAEDARPNAAPQAQDVAPAVAWRRFTEVVKTPLATFDHSRDDFLALLDPFLTNPERHRRHVEMITEAAGAAQLAEVLRKLYGPTMPLFRRLMGKPNKRHREFLAKLAALEAELSASVQPGRINVDVLPTRTQTTHEDWLRQGKHLELIQLKIAVLPNEGFEPTRVSVVLSLADAGVRCVDHFPATEFKELGTQEIEVSDEGKFVEATGEATKAGGQLGAHGAKLSGERAETKSTETTTATRESRRLTFTPTVRKVISSAVRGEAEWTLLATHQDAPIGGLDFFASIMVEGEARVIPTTITVGARFEGWGDLRVEHAVEVSVSGMPAAA